MKVLLFGLGSIGQRHARILRQVTGGDVELGAFRQWGRKLVINDDLSVIEGVDPAEHLGVRSFSRLEDAFAWAPAAAFITNPISMHVESARLAIEAGCHVFIEKPLSHSDEGVAALAAAARARRLTLAVGYQLRHHPALALMRRWAREGAIGRVCAVDIEFGEYLPTMHAYEDYRLTHMARRDQGGGAILCLSHEIDAMCWVFGEPSSVLAIGGHLSDLALSSVEDVATMLFAGEFAGRKIPMRVHLDFLQRPPRRRYRIVGDAGSIEFDYHQRELALVTSAGRDVTSFTSWHRNQMFEAEVTEFISCVRGERNSAPLLDAALSTHRVCMAACRSLASGMQVLIDRT